MENSERINDLYLLHNSIFKPISDKYMRIKWSCVGSTVHHLLLISMIVLKKCKMCSYNTIFLLFLQRFYVTTKLSSKNTMIINPLFFFVYSIYRILLFLSINDRSIVKCYLIDLNIKIYFRFFPKIYICYLTPQTYMYAWQYQSSLF